MPPIWPPDENNPPADNDQKVAAEAFHHNGKIVLEAPPGTGKTFLGIYLALCAYRLGWTSSDSPALFLTFSRNARVQIEQELQRYRHNGWFNTDEERSIKIYNFHPFYFEMIQQKAGIWGCSVQLRPASILEHKTRLIPLLSDAQRDDKSIITQANLVYALNRFPIEELIDPTTQLLLDNATFERLNDGAKSALLQGHPQYDDFAPLFLNLLELCPEFVDWIRTKYPLIIVDEFQDTDIVQLEILKRIHPAHFVILYDRYQMIYEWRGARLNRVEQIKSYLNIMPHQEKQLTQIHRCGNQVELPQFIQQLRTDELIGNNVTSNGNRPWLRTYNVRPLGGGIPVPVENRCLSRLRYTGMINFRETTAILTRTNFMADYLYEHLRVRSDHGNHYSCRWIGGEDNPDEKIRDLLWRLEQVNSNSELRSWLGILLDLLLPQSILNGLNISFSSEFGRETDKILARRTRVEFQSILNSWNTILNSLTKGNYHAISSGLHQVIVTANELVSGNGYLDPDLIYYINQLKQSIDKFSPSKSDDEWLEFCIYLENSHLRTTYFKLRSPTTGLYILTVHQSKGREFDHVIIPWLSGSGEPSQQAGRRRPRSRYDFNRLEDRKLLYVAITRAKNRVTLVYPEDDPSPFLRNWKLI